MRHKVNHQQMAEGNPEKPNKQINLKLINPTVERGPSHKVRIKKLPKEKSADKSMQTKKQKK